MADSPKRVLSGIQPSGALHLGNYLGAIKQHIALQDEGECFYFIANYHALTTSEDPNILRQRTQEAACTYLALGLDPERATFYRQSDVPAVTELAWLLSTVAGMGLLERAHSYKDKVAKGISPSVGLFTYPVLMAADILAFGATTVPVGKDQVQHIEMCRDIAQSFNATYGEVFVIPESTRGSGVSVPGTDGQKMSKSYNNTIPLFASPKIVKKAVMGIVTDSTPLEAPKDPEKCTVFALYSLLASPEEVESLRAQYLGGNFGYGSAKKTLLEKLKAVFGPFQERYEHLVAHPDEVEAILQTGAQRARKVANEVVGQARNAVGL